MEWHCNLGGTKDIVLDQYLTGFALCSSASTYFELSLSLSLSFVVVKLRPLFKRQILINLITFTKGESNQHLRIQFTSHSWSHSEMSSLNLDVLALVIKGLSTYDALSISTSCKYIHALVLRQTLSTVNLQTFNEFDKFPDFVLADPHKRIPLMRRIAIDTIKVFFMPPPSLQKFASFLTTILTRSSHLRAIDLSYAEFLFRNFPDLEVAFIRNESLVELSLSSSSAYILHVLKDMRSSLRVISLDFMLPKDHSTDFSWLVNHDRLEKLSLFVGEGEWHGGSTQWPSVLSLEIGGCVPMAPFVSAFPNVRLLCTHWWGTFDSYSPNRRDPLAVEWPYLDHVIEPPQEFFRTWQIRCPVRWLEFSPRPVRDISHVHACNPRKRARKHSGMFEAIRQAQPKILTLSAYYMESNFWEEFSSASRDVKLLELTIHHIGYHRGMKKWMVSIFRITNDQFVTDRFYSLTRREYYSVWGTCKLYAFAFVLNIATRNHCRRKSRYPDWK